ncbi:spindle and centriole-associated protein 1 isoform X3 [Xenopus tropicalis]|uniref:Spindle and centriole-associated protein 1 n=1 Tax=Xenopus tropicalis TaxID=8364 RepID=A0A6I8PWW9_XENTR|nr:spindle and centriole-associated protein 1 isoform X3 [Xenopus tropicalis]|eukprot:XP_012811971.1 PREDICTED: spindle and centriole-associated protein 1 isoform X3 [Xenopus tropicalis]
MDHSSGSLSMSYLRAGRTSTNVSLTKKPSKGKKKPQARKEWDSTVSDLTVLRATNEELEHRREIHRSKNQWLARWELQNKATNKKSEKENGGYSALLENSRLALMKEILSDQYLMNDVLERSDRALAVVKDLFGDAPRRHTGFPSVTMAPSCDLDTSRAPIVQKKDPPTQLSILSESIMDSQAINEVDKSLSPAEYSDSEAEVTISTQPNRKAERGQQLLSGEGPKNEAFITPCKSGGDPSQTHCALNATTAVNRVKVRRTEEESPKPEESESIIGRVLNPQGKANKRISSKGKKTRSATPSHTKDLSACRESQHELTASNQSSLGLLNSMIQEVEQDLAEYERQTGREVISAPPAHGLTGFTLSLVSSLKRVVSYLKESDLLLQREVKERQHLQGELVEQRLMLDALTAEILTLKEGNNIHENHLQTKQRPEVGGDKMAAIPQEMEELPVVSEEPCRTSAECNLSKVNQFLDSQDGPDTDDKHGRLGVSKEECGPCLYPQGRAAEEPRLASSVPSRMFQQAVLLSPPRQKTVSELSSQSAVPKSYKHSNRPAQGGQQVSHHPTASTEKEPPSQGLEMGQNQINRLQNEDLVSHMQQLALQNAALKAQLGQIHFPPAGNAPEGGKSVPAEENRNPEPATDPPNKAAQVPGSLEMRIAELNRQSAEARNKLLKLIEQQKQSIVVSPTLSPITPQDRRTDSSLDTTPPSSCRTSGTRFSSASNKSTSSINSSFGSVRSASAGRRSQADSERGEGWFALSAHVS